MKFLDLEKKYKMKLSGSIGLQLKYNLNFDNYKIITAKEIFEDWILCCTDKEEGKIYYLNKGVILKDYELDNELLQDIGEIFEVRLEQMKERLINKLSNEKATDKQIKFANKLYKKIYGVFAPDEIKNYNKGKINNLINELKEKYKNNEESKVINLFDN
ncbi:hypothetical protein P5F65_13565 [Clostridium perfringens]|nr:hypothetical protein [Clostridium perfringens]ELC8402841.1 hypothetical protein [Clostridium perfringens]MDK0755012.1 hypothetical protein [Clostridium perfringens]MDK0758144.1 hypothetical protein [Clostridium perfringens]MDK0977726.1 hypothetical protein [Clostridium perfringens]